MQAQVDEHTDVRNERKPAVPELAPRRRVLAIEDHAGTVKLYIRALKPLGYSVACAGTCAEGLKKATERGFDAILLDFELPDGDGVSLIPELQRVTGAPIVMVTSHASMRLAVKSVREGAHDFLEKPFGIDNLRVVVSNAVKYGRLSQRDAFHRERAFDDRYRIQDETQEAFEGFPERIRRVLRKTAPSRSTILITGETGVGKEHAAARIHAASMREGAFVAVNCGAIPAQLAESELFGHEKGAFTGAVAARPGKFEIADGGTLFLDEVGELPVELQPKLLRALDTGLITPIGAREPRKVDVRILAATNRDLEDEVDAGRFREDLFFRLNVVRVEIPPLRERRAMVRPLAELFLRHAEQEIGRRFDGFADDALEQLATYSFPGNVRELANAVERAALLEEDDRIHAETLGLHARRRRCTSVDADQSYRDAKAAFEHDYFSKLMERADGNMNAAAERAGLHRNSLRSHLQQLGLASSKSSSE